MDEVSTSVGSDICCFMIIIISLSIGRAVGGLVLAGLVCISTELNGTGLVPEERPRQRKVDVVHSTDVECLVWAEDRDVAPSHGLLCKIVHMNRDCIPVAWVVSEQWVILLQGVSSNLCIALIILGVSSSYRNMHDYQNSHERVIINLKH